jgi:hypothetical protein
MELECHLYGLLTVVYFLSPPLKRKNPREWRGFFRFRISIRLMEDHHFLPYHSTFIRKDFYDVDSCGKIL